MLFPRLLIASGIFNTSSKCVEPLYLHMSEVLDKYSGSSSELLSITNRVSAAVSKDILSVLLASNVFNLIYSLIY